MDEHKCRPRPKSAFTPAEGKFVVDFLERYEDTPEVRDNPVFHRFRSLIDSLSAKIEDREPCDAGVAELNALTRSVYAEARRIAGELQGAPKVE